MSCSRRSCSATRECGSGMRHSPAHGRSIAACNRADQLPAPLPLHMCMHACPGAGRLPAASRRFPPSAAACSEPGWRGSSCGHHQLVGPAGWLPLSWLPQLPPPLAQAAGTAHVAVATRFPPLGMLLRLQLRLVVQGQGDAAGLVAAGSLRCRLPRWKVLRRELRWAAACRQRPKRMRQLARWRQAPGPAQAEHWGLLLQPRCRCPTSGWPCTPLHPAPLAPAKRRRGRRG